MRFLFLLLLSLPCSAQPLPALLDYFDAVGNRVAWKFQKAEDLQAIHLEHSDDGATWSVYTDIPRIDGYQYTTVNLTGYYRLHLIGATIGSPDYSHTVVVKIDDKARRDIYSLDGKYLGKEGTVVLPPQFFYLSVDYKATQLIYTR